MDRQRAPPNEKCSRKRKKEEEGTIVEIQGVEIQGRFDAQRFFDTLALILSNREKVKITVKVTREKKGETEAAGHKTAAA